MLELDDYCKAIKKILQREKRGLTFNQLILKLAGKTGTEANIDMHTLVGEGGSVPTVSKHLKLHLLKDDYVKWETIQTNSGHKDIYTWHYSKPKLIGPQKPVYLILKNIIQIDARGKESSGEKLHHIWYRELLNQSGQSKGQYKVKIDGETEHDWRELNPHIYMHKGSQRVEMFKDRPPEFLKKEKYAFDFFIEFPELLHPNEKIGITLEYDWEEPEKFFQMRDIPQTQLLICDLLLEKDRKAKLEAYWVEPMTWDKLALPQKAKRTRITLPNGNNSECLRFQLRDPATHQFLRYVWDF